MPGYQACTIFVSQAGRLLGRPYLPDTPPAAGRAWVPGCRARTRCVRTSVLRRNPAAGKTCRVIDS